MNPALYVFLATGQLIVAYGIIALPVFAFYLYAIACKPAAVRAY